MLNTELFFEKAQKEELPILKLMYAEQILDMAIVHYALQQKHIESEYGYLAEEILTTMDIPKEITNEYHEIEKVINKGLHQKSLIEALRIQEEEKRKYIIEVDRIIENAAEVLESSISFYNKLNEVKDV